ncbi:hypothetical protein ACUXV3_02585 [Roseobacteraceae bacterium NS-SX3]
MSAGLCRQCAGHGFDRENHVCTLCGGSGRDPFVKASGSIGTSQVSGGRRNRFPIRKSAQVAIIAVGLVVGFVIYRINGATDDAVGLAALAFVGTLIVGIVLVRVLGKPLQMMFLVALFFAADRFVFDGALAPRSSAILWNFWTHIQGVLLP